MKITTKNGDSGKTDLKNEKVEKADNRIEIIGKIDTLISSIDFIIFNEDVSIGIFLNEIKTDLSEIMANISGFSVLNLNIRKLENEIEKSEKINTFISPNNMTEAYINFVRCLTREVEVLYCRCFDNKQIKKYLNRLSDYLFVLMIRRQD